MTESPLLLQELLRKTANGDAAAFAQLYKHTAGKLFGVAIRISGRGELAEDALQESFVTVWQRAADYDPMRGAAMSWLIAIVRNCTIDRLRRQGTRPESHTAPEEALARLASRMVFGTDWPGVPGVQRNARAVEKVLGEAGCSQDQIALALGGNAARIFRLTQ